MRALIVGLGVLVVSVPAMAGFHPFVGASPFTVSPSVRSGASVNLGLDYEFDAAGMAVNIISLGAAGAYRGGTGDVILSSGMFFRGTGPVWFGARLGMLASSIIGSDGLGFGGIAMRFQPDSIFFFESTLGLAGAGTSFSQMLVGVRL